VTTTLENFMLGSRFTEMHSGLRAYTRECLLSLPFHRYSDDFSFDSQLLVDAVTRGHRVVEVPIPTRYGDESSSISVLRSLKYVAHSLAYCARQSAARGRRGQRSPLIRRGRQAVNGARGPTVARRCIACGAREHVLLYPANVADEAPASEYSCTSGALAQHDDIFECLRCGMVSSQPRLEPSQILERYAAVEDEEYFSEEEGRRELFEWVLDVMSGYFVPGKRLLEVGSNVGLFLDTAQKAGWSPRGIEPSRWAVETGRRRFGVDLEQRSLESLEEAPRSADAVVLLDVLEHLVDPVDSLRRLRQVVADDGILVLSTINLAGLHARLRGSRWPWLIRPHLHYFTPATLHRILESADFQMVEWRLVPRSFHLSYVANRARTSLGALGEASAQLSQLVDFRVPVGWLGDVVLLLARPSGAPGRLADTREPGAASLPDDSLRDLRAASLASAGPAADVDGD
jgi:2-polyprenyl-3-methyl-5-hydroxy-6-metoxy-1,4-benzoquinol methylase